MLRSGDDWVELAIWNTDGSRAEMSGNGTRIAARWLSDRTGAATVRVVVGPRTVTARVGADSIAQDLGDVRVVGWENVGGYDVTLVDVGNPHAVVTADPGEVGTIGPALETHPRFPERTNVQVVRVEGPGRVTARVWERGDRRDRIVGHRARSRSRPRRPAKAGQSCASPGGELAVEIAGGKATLIGPVERVAG